MRGLSNDIVEGCHRVLAWVRREPEENLFDDTASVVGGEYIGREVIHHSKHHRDREPVPEDANSGRRSRGVYVFSHYPSILTGRRGEGETGRRGEGFSIFYFPFSIVYLREPSNGE